ncbi:ATP-binding protein [Falsirhodobacter sp. 20TX0035]|uniref:ATP-binding protein n=1 Tax=Falsirhodobacter sp. 20TX0035 TaxID=3022019 RepID=UPI00232AF2A6|nr:ATP-binding protein [Falsirhodobacter sp. 20TX0035]MDB6452871.1 ATP-binding protein [Falsirhodobacter sp. 20TX0035]
MTNIPLPPPAATAGELPVQATLEARYRALFEAIDDGFCIIEFIDGPEGPLSNYVHIESNSGYQRHTGIPDIVGKTVYDVAPNDAPEWVALYGRVLASGQPLRFERSFTEIDRHIEVSAARLEPASLRQVSVLFRDITERKRNEAALLTSEALARENIQRVQLALEAGAIIGTWLWDVPANRFTVDDALAASFGLDPALSRADLTLAQLTATVHPDDKDALTAQIRQALATGGTYAHQYRTRRSDNRYYWLEAKGRVDLGPDGEPLTFSGVLLDIEGRRAAEAERERMTQMLRGLNDTLEQRVAEQTAELMAKEEALRQSQKMEAVGQLTGGIAHDFNNLLAGISGSLDMIQGRVHQNRTDDLDRYISAAQAAAKRAAALTHRLLAFSRRQTLDPKPTDAARLVADMLDLVQRSVGPQITVTTRADTDLWSTLVDPNQLENALLNLCLNARDAMPDGGRIAIDLHNCTLGPAEADDLDLPPGEYVALSVADTGSGMTADVIEKAFDPFFTTKPLGVGTGLGLSMIYGFARQSGGQVQIASQPGAGSTLHLYLPREQAPAKAASAPVHEPARPAHRTVLVTDDEPIIRMLLVDVIEDLGLTALEAGDGPQALKILRSDTPIDLLITDVGLPNGMNGRQVADAARELRPGLKVMFVTGYAETTVLGQTRLDPGMEIMTKPFDIGTLSDRVRRLLDTAD